MVVFVARRALLLYRALETCGCIDHNPNSHVLSSRALNFAAPTFLGRTVAFVDDVVVEGQAMHRACECIGDAAEARVGLVAASCAASAEKRITDMGVKLQVLRHLEERHVYELTREINDFVQSVGLTNNIDQPEFRLEFPKGTGLREALQGHEWFNCSTELQRAMGVLSATITYEADRLPYVMPEPLSLAAGSLIKVRLIGRVGTNTAVMLPFVVMPSLSDSEIGNVFEWLVSKGLDSHAADTNERCGAERCLLENKLRIIQYYLSWQLGNAAAGSFSSAYAWVVEDRESMLFGTHITGERLRHELKAPACRSAELAVADVKDLGRDLLSRAVRAQYLKHDIYFKRHMSREVGRVSLMRLTTERLLTEVSNAFVELDKSMSHESAAIPVATSVCLDHLIDCGVIVPVLKYDRNEQGLTRLVRAYRSGEIERLSIREMELFSYVIWKCLRLVKRTTVRRSTINRLAVLYAREMQRDRTAGLRDVTSVFDFAYTSEGELSETTESNPYGANFLADILVDKKLLAWAQKNKSTLKVRSAVQSLEGYGLTREEAHRVEAIVQHFADYLNVAKGTVVSMDTDELLDVLIMRGSKRYVLGSVSHRLGGTLGLLDALEHPAKLLSNSTIVSLIKETGGLEELVNELHDRCAWALGEAQGEGQATSLQDEFDTVAQCLKRYDWSTLYGYVSGSGFMGADESLANECIASAMDFGKKLQDLVSRDRFWQSPYALRLLEGGKVLKRRIDTLNLANISHGARFSVTDNAIGIIACTSTLGMSNDLNMKLSFFVEADDIQQRFSLRKLVDRNDAERFGLLIIAFKCDDAAPHEIMRAGEVQYRDAMSTLDRFSIVFSLRMRRAIHALFERYANVGTRLIALCHNKEEDAFSSGALEEMLGSNKGFADLGCVAVDDDIDVLFKECGTSITLHNFGEW